MDFVGVMNDFLSFLYTSKNGRCLEVSGLVAIQILPPGLSCERMPLKMSTKSSSTLILCNAWKNKY